MFNVGIAKLFLLIERFKKHVIFEITTGNRTAKESKFSYK